MCTLVNPCREPGGSFRRWFVASCHWPLLTARLPYRKGTEMFDKTRKNLDMKFAAPVRNAGTVAAIALMVGMAALILAIAAFGRQS